MRQLQVIINIELPQMLRFSVPGIINEFSSVLKATPFAYTVGIAEITKQAMSLTAITLNGLQIYTLAGVLYFIIYKVLLFWPECLRKISHQLKHKNRGDTHGFTETKRDK